jgi:predicted esterase
MEISAQTLQVAKTAHYYTYGKLGSKTKYFLFVCHGYAQKADAFLEWFAPLPPDKYYIVAPEGFSRFYRKGFEGDVVASWMTKADRLDEIHDYSRFLQTLYEQEVAQLDNEVKIILLGFSQGASTIIRWVTARFPYYDVLINWAGWIPEDLDYEPCRDYFSRANNYFLYGLDDPFLPQDRIAELQDRCTRTQLPFRFFHFDGKHEVDPQFLRRILAVHARPRRKKS